jgi:serine/threonine protein kinase/tetratricopeptide (TPR) repeat protein
MKATEWEKIKALFDAALNVPKEDRISWLDRACDGSPELRETLLDLLRSWDESSFADDGDVASQPVFSAGQLVGNRFRILRLIARGGMGEVYEAQDSSLNGLRVALKTIRPEIAPEKHAYERFKREVWVARELTHDGICRIFDLVEHVDTSEDGVQRVVPCLTMQLLDGKTLAAVIAAKRPLTIDESLPLIRQMVEALQAMHDKGIVHRDIKPSNIMLVECGSAPARVVVMDFGLAKPVQQRSLLWESRGVERAGAPYFIAPEILRGEKGGIAVDVYALGLVIDEMVTSSPAFPNESIEELFWKKLHTDPIAPSARIPQLPVAWEQTIMSCLDRLPDRRPPSVTEVLRLLEGESILAIQPPRLIEPPVFLPPSSPMGDEAPRVPLAAPTRRWWLGAGAASILLPAIAAIVGGGATPVQSSILVYPFVNLTRESAYDYLCTGTADELLRRLIYVDGLSVFPVRDVGTSSSSIERRARFSLQGNLNHHDGRIRLAVQLIDNETGSSIWAEEFERELRDPLALESEIAENVVDALTLRLPANAGPGARAQYAARGLAAPVRRWLGIGVSPLPSQATLSSAAFTEYILGRQLWQKRTVKETLKAIEHFQRAITQDPKFALAYSALADAQHTLLTYNHDDGQKLLAAARQYAEQAVALDASLPEVHVSLAAVRQMLWDWPGSEEAYRAAIRSQPKFARAHHWFGGLLLQFGRFEEALAEARKGLELDPFDYPSQSAYGMYLWHAGRLREAASHLEALLAKTDLLYGHTVLGQVYAALAASVPEPEATDFFVRSLREASIVRAREFDAAGGNDSAGFLKWSDTLFAQAHSARRDRASAQLYVERLEHGVSSGKLSASSVAWAHAAAGNTKRAIELLEMGLERHEREMLYVKVAPLFRPLYSHPRFQAILNRMQL